jgi:phenylacetate-CoA ligase
MNRSVARTLLFALEYLRRENLRGCLCELEDNLHLTPPELNSLQRQKRDELVVFAATNSRFYRDRFRGKDGVRDFASLPILTKEDVRSSFRDMVSDQPRRPLDLVETSGSTGVPLQFFRDRIVFGYTLAALYRAHRWWGIEVGAKEAMLWGVPVSVKGRIRTAVKDLVLNRFREREYNLTQATLDAFLLDIQRERPEYVFGYSSMVHEFARHVQEKGIALHDLRLKAVICTAERIGHSMRNTVEAVFGCPLVSEYGATEVGIVSYQCPEGRNHVADDCVYVEIVDDQGNPLPDGERGRVVVTVLNSHSSPFIRYDLGDISAKVAEPCPCGRPLSVLADVEGRVGDVVYAPDGRSYHSIIFYYIMKELTQRFGGVRQFKVYQSALDRLELQIVKTTTFGPEAEQFIRDQVREKFGNQMTLELVFADAIPRKPSGKFRDFESAITGAAAKGLRSHQM